MLLYGSCLHSRRAPFLLRELMMVGLGTANSDQMNQRVRKQDLKRHMGGGKLLSTKYMQCLGCMLSTEKYVSTV